MHGSVRFEHAAQGCEPGIRVREMMKNSGADNLIEVSSLVPPRDRWAVDEPEDWLSRICV